MKYIGKLYGKIGGKHFDTGKTSADWDQLENVVQELCDERNELEKRYATLKQSADELAEALENIAEPISYLQKQAKKEGATLDGIGAINVVSQPQFYKDIAEAALTKYNQTNKEK